MLCFAPAKGRKTFVTFAPHCASEVRLDFADQAEPTGLTLREQGGSEAARRARLPRARFDERLGPLAFLACDFFAFVGGNVLENAHAASL